MSVKRSALSVFAVLIAATSLSCSDSAEPEVVTDVEVVGAIRTMLVGQTLQFAGRATTNHDTRLDGLITWSVSNPAILSLTAEFVTIDGTVVNRATVTGLAVGTADVIATAQGITDFARVTVNPSGSTPPP